MKIISWVRRGWTDEGHLRRERKSVCRVEVVERPVSTAKLGRCLDAGFDVPASAANSRWYIGALSETGCNGRYIAVSIISVQPAAFDEISLQASEQPVPWVLVLF